MIPAIQEIGFGPGTNKAYATLHQATVSFAEMGERTISTQVRIDGDVVPDFAGWELSFKGERFILNTKEPQAAKDNSTRNSLVDLTFVSWVVNELKRYFFFEPTSIDASTAIADKYKASVNLPVEDFAVLFNKVLDYYFDGKVVFSLYMSGQGQYSTDRALVEIDYTYIWDVLVKFFEIYGVRWRIEYDSTNDVYTIKAGWPTTDIDINDHDFEYGYQGGLLRFERQVQDVNIHNILLGRGGEKNIPYRYFKRIDPQNPDWAADPDAIPELSNIYFDRLRDINFRWYVRGWMQNPNHDTSWEDGGYVYPTYTIASDSPYYFAYQKGLTDEKFNPVEYVKDDESIADYGEHWGALDDNDDIFPTIQGVTRAPLGRIDEAVAVSEIVTDDIEAMAQNAAIEKSINRMTISLDGDTRTAFDIQSEEFTIPSGSTGNVTYVPVGTEEVNPGLVRFDTDNSSVVAVSDGTEYPIDAIPAGTYRLKLHLVIARTGQASSATGTFGIENIVLTTSTMDTDAWKPTFDIWVKNIWGTTKGQDENEIQYAERVWLPILGDRAGNEAKIVFSTGFMSVSEDYEFTIASYPVYDTSKSINGVPSEWRITLRKSDAEFDATGLYIPNASTGGHPVAGDKFFFIGIDMPHAYVTLAEEDLNTNKTAQLDTEAAISPTWVMNLDKVRVHTLEDQEYGRTLADRLAAGGKVWIKDKRFTPGKRLQLYVQSITYTWNEPTDESPYIVPDIEVVLSDKVVAVDSVVQRIQNDVSSIKNQYARISDVEAVVRSVAEPIFLKKTGESDSSDSPTQFSSKVTSKGFRQGAIGGTGWGIYRDNTKSFAPDEQEQASPTRSLRSLRATRPLLAEEEEDADAVIEADRIVVRKELQVNSLVINQIAYIGGKEIISAAKIEVSKVIETVDSYICYFDQRRNSVANNFAVNDIAFGQVFNPDNTELRYYKMVVTATDVDCITLSKTPNDGSGVPKVGDIIVQYGNTTNASRQYVIVRDVIGGGYERMLSELSTVSSTGKEYYFAGRQGNAGPRWFVGDSLGDYAEYENGVLTIKANVIFKAGQTIPGLSELENQVDNLEYLHTALPKSDTIVSGGLILSKVIALRDANENIKSGINGDPSLSSIAAWYGGPMADKEASPTPASYAKSLFRFDGSGYLAGGNIRWNDQGYGSIPGVSWDNGEIRISGDVKLTSVGNNTVTSLLTAVQNMPNEYVTLATTQTISGYKTFTGGIQIGDATITWVEGTNGNPGYLRINKALLTVGDQIVVDGTPGGGGGGGGSSYLRDLLDVSVSSRNNGDILRYNGSVWVSTAPSQLPVATATTNGLMSSSDYTKLGGIADGATAVVESTVAGWGFTKNTGTVTRVKVGNTSYNPTSGVVSLPAYPTTLPASDVYAWAKASTKPSYAFSEITGTASTSQIPTLAISKIDGLQSALDSKQPKDNDLTAIAALTGGGILHRNTDNTWELDDYVPIKGINTEEDITRRGIRGYQGGGANWTGSISSMAYAAILALGTHSRGWQMWAARGDTALYWRNGNQDANAWSDPRIIYDSLTLTKAVLTDLLESASGYYVKKAGDTMTGDLTIQKSGGGTLYLRNNASNSTGGDIIFRSRTNDVNGVRIAGVRSTSPYTYDRLDLVFYVSNTTDQTYSWEEAMRIAKTKAVSINASLSIGATLGVTELATLTGGASIPATSYLKIGSATITWNSNGYLHIDKPLVTAGDQIVISGTPGGGGGGGATTLAGLDDTNIPSGFNTTGAVLFHNGSKWVPSTISSLTTNDLLQWNGTTWANVAASSVGRIYSAGTGISISNSNAISLSATYAGGTAVTLNGQSKAASTASFYAPATAGTTGQILKATTNGAPVWTSSALGDTNKPIYLNASGVLTAGVSCLPLTGGYIQSASGNKRLRITTDNSANYIQSWASDTASANLNISGYNGNAGSNLYLKFDNIYAWDGSANKVVYHAGNFVAGTNYQAPMSQGTGITISNNQISVTANTYAPYNANGYLPLNGGTLSGLLLLNYANARIGFQDGSGTTLGVIGVRSAGTLEFYDTTWRTVWHANNSNLSTVDWTTKALNVNGRLYMKGGNAIEFDNASGTTRGMLSATDSKELQWHDGSWRTVYHSNNANKSDVAWTCSTLTIASTAATSHLVFSRQGVNYITAPASGSFGFVTNGKTPSWANSDLCIGTGAIEIHGTLDISGDTTSHGNIYLDNGKYIVGTLADGTTTANLLGMSSADQCIVAYGMRSTGTTSIFGQTMNLRSAATVGPEIHIGCGTHNKDAATIYFNSHITDIRNGIKIGAEYAASADRLNLVVYTSNVGTSPYAPSWSPTLKVTYTGMVGIGLSAPSEKLHVDGNILSTGDQVVSSDITKKTNLIPIDLKVEQIAAAPAVTFDWKTGGHSFGSIAQYWKDVLGEAVLGEEGNYALAYGQLALVNTIVEAREIDDLKARVAELEEEVKRLRMN